MSNKKKTIFPRRVKFDFRLIVMAVNEVRQNWPEIMSCSTAIKKLVLRLWLRPSDSRTKHYDFLFELNPVSRWMFSVPRPSKKNYCLNKFSALLDVITFFALKLLTWISDTFILYSSSKFNPRLFLSKFSRVQDVIGKKKQAILSDQTDGFAIDLRTNRRIFNPWTSLNGLLCSVFASEARDPICCADSCNISWNPSTPFHPYLIVTKQELSFFLSFCVLRYQQSDFFLNDKVMTYNDSKIEFTEAFAKL